jgi:hypothetical protein
VAGGLSSCWVAENLRSGLKPSAYCDVHPPSMYSVCPVTNAAGSEQR